MEKVSNSKVSGDVENFSRKLLKIEKLFCCKNTKLNLRDGWKAKKIENVFHLRENVSSSLYYQEQIENA